MLSRPISIVFVLALSVSGPLLAQNYPQRGNLQDQLRRQQQQQMLHHQQRQQQMMPQPANFTGTIVSVSRGAIMATDQSGRNWKVIIPAEAKVEVTGTATVDFLKAGLMVDIKTEFDDRGKIKDKIGELTVVAPSSDRPLGIFPVGDGDAAGGPDASGGKPAKRAAKAAKGKSEPPAGPCRIVGKLANNRGAFTVQVRGMTPIELEFSDQIAIKVELEDYSAAEAGDAISVKGMEAPSRATPAGRPVVNTLGMAQATEVKITLAQPLEGKKKKTPPPKTPPQRSKKDADH